MKCKKCKPFQAQCQMADITICLKSSQEQKIQHIPYSVWHYRGHFAKASNHAINSYFSVIKQENSDKNPLSIGNKQHNCELTVDFIILYICIDMEKRRHFQLPIASSVQLHVWSHFWVALDFITSGKINTRHKTWLISNTSLNTNKWPHFIQLGTFLTSFHHKSLKY